MDDTELLAHARETARWYEDHLADRDTFLYCEDGFDLQVHWERAQLPHLTGLWYRKGRKDFRPVAARLFYKYLLSGQRIDMHRLDYTTSKGHAIDKADVLPEALRLRAGMTVYEITKGVFLLGVGTSEHCLGLVRDESRSIPARMVYMPKSVYKGDVTGTRGFTVKATHEVLEAVTR